MPVLEGLAVGDKALGSNMAADLVIQDSTSEETETPLFKAEIISYPDSDARDPIIASSENNINIIFTISKEKFRRMALAVLDHCEKANPGKKHEFSSASSDLATDPSVLTTASNSKSHEVCDTMCDKTTQSIEYSSEERVVEKNSVYEHVSSSENVRCMNMETSLTFNEENMAETASKCHELELDSKETSNISFSSQRNETISSNLEENEDILEVSGNSPLKQYFSEDPAGDRGIVVNQSVEKDSSRHNESEIQIDCKSSQQKTESKRIESDCTDKTVIDKLNVDENISISQEFTVKEFSDMFPTMKTEEIEILKIESEEGTDSFTKYFKLDLTNQFVVLKITTVDENFLMNAYKSKVISTDSVTYANTSTEDHFHSQCMRKISSNFSNEKSIVSKADSPKTSNNLVAAINSEKLAENEENILQSNNEEILYEKNTVMDTSNISVANEDGDLENQSTCSDETNKLIELSLDLERSQELDQKEIMECSKITQPDEFSESRSVVDSAKLLDLKDNTDTQDNVRNIDEDAESSVNDNRLECSFSTKQCLNAKSMEKKSTGSASSEEMGSLSTSDNLHLKSQNSYTDSKEILASSKEFVDFENNLGKMDVNKSSTQENQFVEDSYSCKDRNDNSDSLNVTSENLETEQTESAENTSFIITSNLEPKSEVREKSFTLSFSEFADEKSPNKSENEKADLTKSVEDNLENLSEEMVSEENNETGEDPENIEKYSEDCLNADETFTVPEVEITAAVYSETSSEIIIAKKNDSPELIAVKLMESSIETDSGASESKPEDNSLGYSECSGKKAENIIEAGKRKKKCEAMDEGIEALQSSNELKEQLADDLSERMENESCERADIDLKKESIEEIEDANETKSSIDVYENEAETYEITKCEPQNEILESDPNTQCFEKDIEKADTLVISEDIESVEKLGLESSRVETKESTLNSEFDDSALIDKEETLHSKTADLSLDVSAIERKTEEPESAADEYATDSETASERDALDMEEVKSVASESDDSRDSESSRSDKNSKKHKSDEVDCAPTRLRGKKLKMSEDVIPENSVVSKSSRSFLKGSKYKSTSKVSPIERSLRSRSLEPVAEPAKSKATTSKTDPESTNRKRATTPEVITKKDIKTAVRSSPRKFTRATSLTADTSKTPRNINRSKIEVPTTSNTSSSSASAPKKRTAKRNGTDK